MARLLRSLEAVRTSFAVLVVDNADDAETAEAVSKAKVSVERLLPGANLGCGGGLLFGEKVAMERFGDRLTHLLLMDDDVEVAPDAMDQMIAAMEKESAIMAAPLITGPDGLVGWTPGFLNEAIFKPIRRKKVTPDTFIAICGSRPQPFSWATGVALMVTREAYTALGPHRDDFWIRGEDLEFSLRYTDKALGVVVPSARIKHLPREAAESPESLEAERRKHRAMLQNVAYISIHLKHGRRILRGLPVNLLRYMKIWGIGYLLDGLSAYWTGAVLGLPAGRTMK